ncbi:pantetheine-phosphate adenylyltransferase [Corynebacterium sp. NML98-0116]|uniref:Phosphopantetheine adenylyltransferase n=2 Tax=Corynebacterium TaxID=1716 RepID=A0ABD4TTS7_9CORY|nr:MULTISPECIES: pantetheine-phosphate adenylyltransferase [Corynebacterium]AOX05684.1 pantetheine-phosphate adenylyltransferase [Corynebacterium sp. NML98-0116]MCO6394838.1 pantetheine-phosphate adenylyltransferase [Corynebacterium lipophilum]MCQ4608488.1 pantetheine-phosphate adenylyltransferase [Corynebacterium pseudogenitalium]MCQ4610132.1 pantetheine-phosphate adenylyltransferase [Corynebacterium sp. CCUG 61414]MCQ4614705.1 pantetheine-phosphate adenylyltransferase [Corynebacterium pseudo
MAQSLASARNVAVCPGSFDPFTNGHLDIVDRARRHFDEVVVLVTGNPTKKTGMFTVAERVALIQSAVADMPDVKVDSWGGLLVDYTSAHGITALVKGLRSSLDYEYELPMAQMNRRLTGVETFFLLTDEKYGYISSSLCKEVARFGGDIGGLVPPAVMQAMNERLREVK